MATLKLATLSLGCMLLCQCASQSLGPPNMGGPSAEERHAAISSEPTGNFYYGRRYFVEKTRFWGYLREPRQPASTSQLVIFRENVKKNPDRLPEDAPPGERYGSDNNHEYRIFGNYTGEQGYDPNSNQFLPIFLLTDYELVDRDPGWLFSPKDVYHPQRFTLWPRQ
ncbi:MAG: hypothetical protein RL346_1721 [Verrucomicrobiota bacterium]|jgi:hypothetical protein